MKKAKSGSSGTNGDGKPRRGEKSEAIRTYFATHKKAMPKEVVAALKEQGINVSPNMVSILKAKAGIKKAKRKALQAVANNDASAATQTSDAAGLDAALTLYKAARGQQTSAPKIRQAFLALVEKLG